MIFSEHKGAGDMSDKNKIRLVLLVLAMYSLASGLLDALLFTYRDGGRFLFLIHGIAFAILIFVWCKLHAKAHGVQEKAFACFTALLPPVGVPLYMFRAFGIKNGLIGTLKALGFFLILALLSTLGFLVGERISS